MKKYILQGNEADVDKVVRENRIRVARGVVEFIPCDEETQSAAEEDVPSDEKNPPVEDDKENVPSDEKKPSGKSKSK